MLSTLNDVQDVEVFPNTPGMIMTAGTILCVGDRYYQTQVLIPENFKIQTDMDNPNLDFKLSNGFKLDEGIAYLMGEYYYLYRGKISEQDTLFGIKPGIYYDDEHDIYTIQEPSTDEEKELYRFSDKISRQDVEAMRNAVLNHDIIIMNIPDKVYSTIPPESVDDDILKRLIKRAIMSKGVDLDQYRTRFASKNMLFNTKQVLRGPNKLSMLLFDRCAEAMNLKYTIIVEEIGDEYVGRPLDGPIQVSSQEVFDANITSKESDQDIVDELNAPSIATTVA